MQRPIIDQAINLIESSTQILLAVPNNPSVDAFASMLGLAIALERHNKETYLVCASHVPRRLQFLPGSSQVREFIEPSREIIVDIPLGDIRPDTVTWEQHEGGVRVCITPERGKEVSGNVTPTTSIGRYQWGAIITLGVSSFEHIGVPFSDHAPFFYETPTVNIDYGTANELFGTVNLVSATASTVAEVTHGLVLAIGKEPFTKDIATCLYAGLVAGTSSFQAPNTTPNALTAAALLLEQDADQQAVTQHLFGTHSLPELRLIGQAFAQLQELPGPILWSALSHKDFQESGASHDDTISTLDEMVKRSGGNIPVLLVFERTPETLEVLMFAGKLNTEDREKIRQKLSGTTVGRFILTPLDNTTYRDNIAHVLQKRIIPYISTVPRD